MRPRLRSALAVLFSLLLVSTAVVGPALAGQVFERLSGGPTDGGPPGGGPPGGPPGGGPPSEDSGNDSAGPPDGPPSGGPDSGTPWAGPPGGGDGPTATAAPGGTTSGGEDRADGPRDGGDGPPGDSGPPDDGPPGDAAPPGDGRGNDSDSDAGPPEDVPGGPPDDVPTTPAGPAGTTPGGQDTPSGPPTLNVTLGNVSLGPNATALDHRRAAAALLASANADGPGNSGSALEQRLLGILNGTFEHVLDERRVLSARVFEDDMRVAAPLHRRAPNVTRHLVVSDRKLAAQAIEDAEAVRAVLDDRNVSYDEAAVAENVSEAREAYRQAGSLPAPAKHAAIPHYREAWTHAQRAIDVMDEAVEPRVHIHTRQDLPHNGTFPHRVNATVFDVRPYELESELVVTNSTADGTSRTTRPVSLAASTVPVTVATVNTTRNLSTAIPADDHTYVLDLTVRDPGVDLADRGYDDEEQIDLHGPQREGDPLMLDADGLPDRYERQVTGTDPLSDDSDFAPTDDEAGDGVPDGAEDPDGDRLATFLEYRLESDPLDPDTDDDNVTDGFEFFRHFDPLDPDVDDDNVTDGAEDPDADGLPNAREEAARTRPRRNDTDGDGLEDGVEVVGVGTDPRASDTDRDGLADREELELGTDPLVPDSDRDGVADGNETFTTAARNRTTGVVVEATGEGDVAGGMEITASNGSAPARVGPAVRVTSRRDFESATVRIPVPAGAAALATNEHLTTEDTSLQVYRWRPGENETWTPVPTTVENGTAVADVSAVGYFAVRDPSEWREATSADTTANLTLNVEPAGSASVSTDERLDGGGGGDTDDCPDDGGSGGGSGGPEIQDTCPTEEPDDTPTATPTDDCPDGGGGGGGIGGPEIQDTCPTEEPDDTPTEPPEDGQCPDDGSGGGGAVVQDTCPTETPTDGDGDGSGDEDARATKTVVVPNAQVATLHVETESPPGNVDEDVVVTVDPVGGGSENFAIGASVAEIDLSEWRSQRVTLRYRADRIDQLFVTADSDGDEFPDSVERATQTETVRIPAGTGEEATFELDPNSADTDGDGLVDGREVDLSWEFVGDSVTVEVVGGVSNPSEEDTDGDGLHDLGEVAEFGSDAWAADTDGDGIRDGDDVRPTEPDDPTGTQDDITTTNENGETVPTQAFLDGMIWGDWGFTHDYEGSRTAAYFVGWLFPYLVVAVSTVPVVEDVVEVALEVRECIAINDALWENALDCGFAAWEVGTSAAKIVSSVATLVGVGAPLLAASYSIDEGADIVRAIQQAASVVRKAPTAAAQPIGRVIGRQFGTVIPGLGRRIADRVPRVSDELVTGVTQGRLMKAGLDEDVAGEVAETVLRRGDDAARYKRIARRIDGLEDLPAAKQVEVIEELGARSDGLRLADELDAGALDAAIQTGRLDEAADIVTSTDGGARTLNELGQRQLLEVLRHDEPAKLVELGAEKLQMAFRVGRFDELSILVRVDSGTEVLRAVELERLETFLTFDLAGVNARRMRIAIVKMAGDSDVSRIASGTVEKYSRALTNLESAGVLSKYSDGIQSRIAEVVEPTTNGWRLTDTNNPQGEVYEIIVDGLRFADEIVDTNPTKVYDSLQTHSVRVFRDGEVTTVTRSFERVEVDSVLEGAVTVEAKSGGIDTFRALTAKIARIKGFMTTELGVPAGAFRERPDPVFRVVAPRGSLSDDMVRTVRQNGGEVVWVASK